MVDLLNMFFIYLKCNLIMNICCKLSNDLNQKQQNRYKSNSARVTPSYFDIASKHFYLGLYSVQIELNSLPLIMFTAYYSKLFWQVNRHTQNMFYHFKIKLLTFFSGGEAHSESSSSKSSPTANRFTCKLYSHTNTSKSLSHIIPNIYNISSTMVDVKPR